MMIICILLVWHREQIIFVKWGVVISEGFQVPNGVRQGSICSIHIDDFSKALKESKIGCTIDEV